MDWRIPRVSLPALTADHLRNLARSGALGAEWPGEHVLSKRLGVSRRTLRAALKTLQKEGLLATSRGRRRRAKVRPVEPADASNRWLAFLSPEREEALPANALRQLSHLRAVLGEEGMRVEVLASPSRNRAAPGRALAEFVKRNPAAVWMLYHSTPAIQAWFAEQGLPCVVDGTPHPESPLPGVDLDWRAIGFHAIGELTRLGHRRIGVVEPERSSVGLNRLNEGLAEGGRGGVTLDYGRHGGSVEEVARTVRRLLAGPAGCTALLVHAYRDLMPVWLAILGLGLRIPGDVGVLCTDDDPMIDRIHPPVAHYRRKVAQHASRLGARVLMALQGRAEPGALLLNAEFVPGGSLGKPA